MKSILDFVLCFNKMLVTSIVELVQNSHHIASPYRQTHEGASDKSRSARHQNVHDYHPLVQFNARLWLWPKQKNGGFSINNIENDGRPLQSSISDGCRIDAFNLVNLVKMKVGGYYF